MRSVGIDLTGSEQRPSGVAFLIDNELSFTKRIKTNKDLMDIALYCQPDVVSIDSPLSLEGGSERAYPEWST